MLNNPAQRGAGLRGQRLRHAFARRLLWVAPILGAAVAGVAYRAFAGSGTLSQKQDAGGPLVSPAAG
jgi:hypothetical protein